MYFHQGIKLEALSSAKRIAIKVGSSLLIDKTSGSLNKGWFSAFISDLAHLHKTNKEIILISSGAVALGRKTLGIKQNSERPDKTEAAASAAVGQIALAHAYQDALKEFDIPVGLMLITAHNTEIRSLYLDLRDTMDMLLSVGAIPVVNENDAVLNHNIRYGDNDRLAARVAGMIGADLLILFSDIDGLYTANPRKNPSAEFIPIVTEVTDNIQAMAEGVGSNVGSGGMATKLLAAKIARSAGCDMVIANGTVLSPISALCNGAKHTFFPAGEHAITARKHWIVGTPNPVGSVTIDKGAVKALQSGSSLLPTGVKTVEGIFERGDCISVRDLMGKEIARGLTGYSSKETFIILGRQTSDIPKLLGYVGKDELIHRNNLVLCD